jgi:nucleotide-binding universal stress UspA family protein
MRFGFYTLGTFVPGAATVMDADGSLESVREDVLGRYQDLMDSIAERLTELEVTAEGVVREGSIGKAIVMEAKEWNADLIVIGAHGLTGVKSLVMGNVARYVVDHAPCSVEVVRSKKAASGS